MKSAVDDVCRIRDMISLQELFSVFKVSPIVKGNVADEAYERLQAASNDVLTDAEPAKRPLAAATQRALLAIMLSDVMGEEKTLWALREEYDGDIVTFVTDNRQALLEGADHPLLDRNGDELDTEEMPEWVDCMLCGQHLLPDDLLAVCGSDCPPDMYPCKACVADQVRGVVASGERAKCAGCMKEVPMARLCDAATAKPGLKRFVEKYVQIITRREAAPTKCCPLHDCIKVDLETAEAKGIDCHLCGLTWCGKGTCTFLRHEGKTCDEMKAMQKSDPVAPHMNALTAMMSIDCPKCKVSFLDFTNCFALTCVMCKCHFCAWCQVDCGRDAHAHCYSCPERKRLMPHLTDNYFGNRSDFLQLNGMRMAEKMRAYIAAKIETSLRPSVRKSLERVLEGNVYGINIISVIQKES